MKPILEELFYSYAAEKKCDELTTITATELKMSEKRLKAHLNKKQRRLLLRIIDAKDLICEIHNQESFIAGFKLGVQVGYESNRD